MKKVVGMPVMLYLWATSCLVSSSTVIVVNLTWDIKFSSSPEYGKPGIGCHRWDKARHRRTKVKAATSDYGAKTKDALREALKAVEADIERYMAGG